MRNFTKLNKITNPSQQKSLEWSGKKGKACRTADNSLEREGIASHFESQAQMQNSYINEALVC